MSGFVSLRWHRPALGGGTLAYQAVWIRFSGCVDWLWASPWSRFCRYLRMGGHAIQPIHGLSGAVIMTFLTLLLSPRDQ